MLSSTATVAQKGDYVSVVSATLKMRASWIIDLGASDHMTSNHTLLVDYIPCHGKLKIRIADGSLSPVAGKGNSKISETNS